MNVALVIGAGYLARLWVKSVLALIRRARKVLPEKSAVMERLTVIQPVTSGDEKLGAILQNNLAELNGAALIWVVDQTDVIARELCESLKVQYSGRGISILGVEEPPDGINPKLWKQDAALPFVCTELIAIIDDDTLVPQLSLQLLIKAVDEGADIATGLPCYVPARGGWSQLVAEFVNSAAILTYLPATVWTEPLSINGMCYVVRTDYVREMNLFAITNRSITDDLAIAKAIRQRGGRIVQTTRPQFISTTVTSLTHYRRLMHRWFVCTRLLVQNESWVVQTALVLAYGLHPALLISLGLMASLSWPCAAWSLFAVLGLRALTLGLINRVMTGAYRHSPLASVFTEIFQPFFLVGASLYPVIWWRRRKIRVHQFNQFEYLRS